jgi:hypothetical protein
MRYVRLVNDVVAVHRPVSRRDVGYGQMSRSGPDADFPRNAI